MTDSKQKNDLKPPVEVPLSALQQDTLLQFVESFIQREGTDYGVAEVELDKKVRQVCRQLETGEAFVVFDPNEETATILSRVQWSKIKGEYFKD